jgi:hypothetical protein
MGSIGWELARMHPQTSYLVEPWALRGYESIHGSVVFTIGALVFLTGLLTSFEFALEKLPSRLIAGAMAVAAVGVAVIYGNEERTMGGGIIGWTLSAVAAYIVIKTLAKAIPKVLPNASPSVLTATKLVVFVAATLVVNLILGSSRNAQPWVWVAIVAVLALGLAITGQHSELAANRMLVFSRVGALLAIALSAAAARVNLLAAQVEQMGVSGQYKDTQITSGYFVALLGMLIAFVGAVSLWATRRDVIINRLRAERQRAAAEASAAEIQAALELAQQHQREARADR